MKPGWPMVYTALRILSTESIVAGIRRDSGFSCTLPYSCQETANYISRILVAIFEHLRKPELTASIIYFIRELVMNASKANSKRVYFSRKKLDIDNPAHYQTGMKNFKNDVFGSFKAYAERLKEQGFFIRIDFRIEGNDFVIRVTNNSSLCAEEKARVRERLLLSNGFTCLEDVLNRGFDDAEGCGLGLAIGLMMLRKLGLSERSLSIGSDGKNTTASLEIPLGLMSPKQSLSIAEEIAAEIERMPQFHESIVRLTRHLKDPNADFNSVAAIIRTDPALTTEIIRVANSPLYMLPHKVSDPAEAVKLIGLSGVKNLTLSFGVSQIFTRRYKRERIEKVMSHSYQVALYASRIAQLKKLKEPSEDVYVAALLHDFGKIITQSMNFRLVERLNRVCRDKNIPVTALEDLTRGYNHALIGSVLAQKWSFPEKFVQCVRFHHAPEEGDPAFHPLTYACCLGDEIFHFLRHERAFGEINRAALDFFSLETEEKFRSFLREIEPPRRGGGREPALSRR